MIQTSNEVLNFAIAMQKKLDCHKKKGKMWRKTGNDTLFNLLTIEMQELKEALDDNDNPKLECFDTLKDIIDECADVANFAMMIADNCQREIDRKNMKVIKKINHAGI